ncbi:unnamed protein product [Notodromas monacha]|uniref:Ig-like domain-containing protein n=1 Tax=Notodromas monacha TaxID=399045 RepID=A0A7R9BY04_9CRUS|nr:unnamed protein product [Notodromas monacha]CAG0922335.1 unnamed protein product [Notodromas monacha]
MSDFFLTWALRATAGDRTDSVLLFNPTRLDDGKTIKCQARNPNLPNVAVLEDSQLLRVLYPPVLDLRFGNKLDPENIKVGDDAYFECDVQASPPLRSLVWKREVVVDKNSRTTLEDLMIAPLLE